MTVGACGVLFASRSPSASHTLDSSLSEGALVFVGFILRVVEGADPYRHGKKPTSSPRPTSMVITHTEYDYNPYRAAPCEILRGATPTQKVSHSSKHPPRDPSLHRPALSFSSVAKNLVGRFHSRMTTRRMRSKESGVACSRMTTRGEHGDNQYQACRAGACSRRKTKEWQNRLTYEVRLCLERTVGDASPYKHNYNPHQSVGVGAHDDPRPLAFSSGRRCRGIAVTDEVFISTNQLLIHRQRRSPFSRRRRLFVSWLLSPPRSFA